MNVKNYRGKSAEECMQKLKSDMGSDAVILQSRTLKPVFGMFGQPSYEIVAASDATTLLDTLGERASARLAERTAATPAPRLSLSSASGSSAVPIKLKAGGRLSLAEAATLAESGPEGRAAALEVITRAAGAIDNDRVAHLEKQIALLTEAMGKTKLPEKEPLEMVSAQPAIAEAEPPAPSSGGLGGFLRYRVPAAPAQHADVIASAPTPAVKPQSDSYEPLFEQLRQARVNDAVIRRLKDELAVGLSADDARSALHDLLASQFLVAGAIDVSPGKMTLAALLGPTGIGKTTTIAKLAASLSISSGASVGLITLDTTRVAGTQQIQTYGEILGVPVKIAYNKLQMEKALVEFAARKTEIVLIDTPGRGPSETLSLAEMSGSLRSVVNLSTYLVLPATLSESNFEHTIQRFYKLASPSALILTKMDETADNHCLGFLVNAQAKYQIPLAYVTTGPRVPDDLLVADAHTLIAKLLTPNIAN